MPRDWSNQGGSRAAKGCRGFAEGARDQTLSVKVVHDEAKPNEASGSVLDEIVRETARQMLAVALQAEVSAYIEAHADQVDENGHRLVVRNGQRGLSLGLNNCDDRDSASREKPLRVFKPSFTWGQKCPSPVDRDGE
jgi:hypothetical protein